MKARQAKKPQAMAALKEGPVPQAFAALLESEHRFRRTFELAGTGVAHIGMDRRFLRVNRRLCEILGYPEAELLRLTGRDISHPGDLDVINQQRPRLYAGEIDSVRVEKRYLRKDRSVVWVAFTMVVERDSAGKPQYEIAFFDDITSRKHAESALRESEERFRSVVNSANEGILVYDRELKVVSVNVAAERIIGIPSAELVGKPGFTSLLACIREDGTPLSQEDRPTRITVKTGQPLTGQIIGAYRKDGTVTWLSVNTALLHAGGESDWYGVVSTIADITAQRKAEAALRASEARFRQTFELAASGIAHVALDGKFLRVNKSLCEILGYDESALIGRSVKQISHPEDRDLTDAQRARVRSGEVESARFEKRYIRSDGSAVWVELAVALVRNEARAPLYEIAVFDDISERKTHEAALREAHEELKRSNSELEQFAYVASHDLQEPLRMVASYTQLLQRRYIEKLDGDAKEFMHYIVDGASRMKQLIEDLLSYSRVGTRSKEYKAVEVGVSLDKALANLKAAITESGAEVTRDKLPVVNGDEVLLPQVFQNLIGNALKFRPKERAPHVHVGVTEHAHEWQFSVRDNGIGIEPEYFERIFMLFQRLHMKGEYPGTGIGLAICKKVAERHGGRIWVESKPGEGSTFHFTVAK
jgi:PAS domain S-box-containing protein